MRSSTPAIPTAGSKSRPHARMIKIPNLHWKLFCAIATQEGFFVPGSRPERTGNPGDLRAPAGTLGVRQVPATAMKPAYATRLGAFDNERFWLPSSLEEGTAAAIHLIAASILAGDSLVALINRWAPASDGNYPAEYVAHVAAWVGITPDLFRIPLMQFLPAPDDPRLAQAS